MQTIHGLWAGALHGNSVNFVAASATWLYVFAVIMHNFWRWN
jgi:hypothetical protein